MTFTFHAHDRTNAETVADLVGTAYDLLSSDPAFYFEAGLLEACIWPLNHAISFADPQSALQVYRTLADAYRHSIDARGLRSGDKADGDVLHTLMRVSRGAALRLRGRSLALVQEAA